MGWESGDSWLEGAQTMWAAPQDLLMMQWIWTEKKKEKTLESQGGKLCIISYWQGNHREESQISAREREGFRELECSALRSTRPQVPRAKARNGTPGRWLRLFIELWMDLGLPDPHAITQHLQHQCLLLGQSRKKWAFCFICLQSENSCSRADTHHRSPGYGRRGHEPVPSPSPKVILPWICQAHFQTCRVRLRSMRTTERERKPRKDFNEWSIPSIPNPKGRPRTTRLMKKTKNTKEADLGE